MNILKQLLTPAVIVTIHTEYTRSRNMKASFKEIYMDATLKKILNNGSLGFDGY